jgi:hypothetical protein
MAINGKTSPPFEFKGPDAYLKLRAATTRNHQRCDGDAFDRSPKMKSGRAGERAEADAPPTQDTRKLI